MAMTEKNNVSATGVNYRHQNGSISHLTSESDMLKSNANGHTKNGLNGHSRVSENNRYKISASESLFLYRRLSHSHALKFRILFTVM